MSTTTTYTGVRIVDMPDLGAVTDNSSVVAEHAGSGRFGAPALRTYMLSNRDLLTPYDFGAVGSTATVWHDDTAALNAAFAQISAAGGGRLYIPGTFYAAGALTVPPFVEIYGNFATGSQQTAPTQSYFQMSGSKLILGTSGLSLGRSCILRNVMVLASSAPQTNPTSAGEAAAVITAMATAGTGITITGDNCLIDTVQVLGFNYGIRCVNNPAMNRQMMRNVHGDCTNGIHFDTGGDTCRIEGAHFWPYLTAMVPGGSTGSPSFQRSGVGIYTARSACNLPIVQCTVFGWQTCFLCDSDSVTWVQCWADGNAPQSAGFATIGACGIVHMIGCVSVANQFSVHHSPSNGAVFHISAGSSMSPGGPGGNTPASGMSIGVLADGHGPVQCIGAYFSGGQAAFWLGANSGPSVIVGNIYDDALGNWDHVYNADPAVLPLLTKHSNKVINPASGLSETSGGTPAMGGVGIPDQMSQLVDFKAGLQAESALFAGPVLFENNTSVTPSIRWKADGVGTDQGLWDALISGTTMAFRTINDAFTVTNVWLEVDRSGAVPTNIIMTAQTVRFNSTSTGFNGTAPIAKPTVTGAKGGNAALASLLGAMAAYGLITDSTST